MRLDDLVQSSRAGYDGPTAADRARVRQKLEARLAVTAIAPAAASRTRRAGVSTATKLLLLAAALVVGTASAVEIRHAMVERSHAREVEEAREALAAPPAARRVVSIPAAPIEAAPAPVASAAPVPESKPQAHTTHVTAPVDSAAVLSAEMKLVQDARDALKRGDPSAALAALDRYDARFKSGTLRPEAAALRVLALCDAGRTDEAHARAAAFARQWPRSPLAPRVQTSCAGAREAKP